MNYKVRNEYGINGESNHKTSEAALKARDKRAGEGWIVIDTARNVWDWNGDTPQIARYGV